MSLWIMLLRGFNEMNNIIFSYTLSFLNNIRIFYERQPQKTTVGTGID